MLKSLKRSNCLLAGNFLATQFRFQPGKLDVSLQNKEVGMLEESVDLGVFDGEIIESRFYSPYMLNGLSVYPEKSVNFFVKNSTKPIIFETKQEDYQFTYLVMPVSSTSTQQ